MNFRSFLSFPCMQILAVATACLMISCAKPPGDRQIVSLDGNWEIGEGTMNTPPEKFGHTIPVPGLVDMAEPPFAHVGEKDQPREAFWYRTTFRVDGLLPEVAVLKIHKAQYNTLVFLNGKKAGENISAFTPGLLPIRQLLKGNGAENELLVRVGAYKSAMPPEYPDGFDNEKALYIPGIYDSVELILSGKPFIQNVQVAPKIAQGEARVVVELDGVKSGTAVPLSYALREARSGNLVAENRLTVKTAGDGAIAKADFSVPVPNAHLWSPDDPFLYTLEISTGADTSETRFGMREFRFDPATGKALLNGKPYFLRGTNVCIHRFFEDSERKNLPWDEKWVRALHEKFKSMGWNSARYTIGFPPEIWYRIADETGLLIQDEYPIWYRPVNKDKKATVTVDAVADDYARWMRERWNHPCVVIWDAQNESKEFPLTGEALQRVRHLDLSNRPWDNGWGDRQDPGDALESHPYFFQKFYQAKISGPVPNPPFRMSELKSEDGEPRFVTNLDQPKTNIIINEYGWLWLNRDGEPTFISRGAYFPGNISFPVDTADQRRYAWARMLAAKTELWRAHRKAAGVLEFCSLSYSRPPADGATSDHFIDVKNLVFEPHFEDFVRDAFSAVGVMLNVWDETLPPGPRQVEVYLINDLENEWEGKVVLSLLREGKTIKQISQAAKIAPLGQHILNFEIDIPSEPGSYQLEAALESSTSRRVRSLRDFKVGQPAS